MTPRRPRPRGFSLLEVMIALAILGAALLSISQITAAALRNHERAIHLELATLLARGKLAALQDGYERTGFKGFDEEEDGTFEDDGHPEVRWKVRLSKPRVDLSPEKILATLTGGQAEGLGDLGKLLGSKAGGGAGGKDGAAGGLETLYPGAGAMAGGLQAQLATIGEQIKQGVRELRLTVSWKDGTVDESFTVVTHVVVLAPPGTTPLVQPGLQAGAQPGAPAAGGPDQPATGQTP